MRRHLLAKSGGFLSAVTLVAFDAAAVLALAIEKAGSDDQVAVRDGKDVDYVEASGNVDFDEHGNVVSWMRVWTVKDNTILDTDIYALPGDKIDLLSIR